MPRRSRPHSTRDAAADAAFEPDQRGVDPTAPDTSAPPHLTADPPREWRIESWPLSGLEQHYRQAALFHDLDGDEFDALIDSIEREGLREPIQVTPDGTIIDGHQRHRAAVQLGWTEIRVRIRDDLAGDQDAIDRAHRGESEPAAARSARQGEAREAVDGTRTRTTICVLLDSR
jgi:hypothetical protein